MKKTIVIGASENTERYSNRAVRMLQSHGVPVIAIGVKEGKIGEVKVQTGFPKIENVDTVTLYMRPEHQSAYYDYIIHLKPARVIFNPGTENSVFEKKLSETGIEALEACTLTMLSLGNY